MGPRLLPCAMTVHSTSQGHGWVGQAHVLSVLMLACVDGTRKRVAVSRSGQEERLAAACEASVICAACCNA